MKSVTIEETFELPSWFKNWVEGIYQSPWQTDRPFDYLVKHVIENDQVRLTTRMDWWHVQSTYTFENFNLLLKYISTLDIDEIAYNAGWE